MLMDAILKLHEKIRHERLDARTSLNAEAQERRSERELTRAKALGLPTAAEEIGGAAAYGNGTALTAGHGAPAGSGLEVSRH
jgi:hypothetical protein